jgi:polyhydroxyalkanoate synthesis regulator phasin
MANRWLLKNTELYGYFESKLSEINPNFSELEEIDHQKSKEIVAGAVIEYGALRTYLFSVINSVVFPQQIYKDLGDLAKEHEHQAVEDLKLQEENRSTESMKHHYEQQISRLTDKYEKKLSGLQKKYQHDVDSLKKQIGNLQRKVDGR